ncbi:unannotated protein [freshwater metagenome]|uniref:Unannotated protein n=1 Tax=freshwater metagenome TaxID=449393 RepID=A0A6J6T324_9ZZZZ
MVSRRTSIGFPESGTPRGARPSQVAEPSRSVNIAAQRTPMNEYRDQSRPGSADSSKKVPARSPQSARNNPTAV